MVQRLIFSFFVLACALGLTAQESGLKQVDDDYRRFRETFDKALNKPDTAAYSQSKIVYHPATLPDWFLNLPGSGESTVYAVGISDPGMEPAEAYSLAVLRAKAVLALLLRPRVTVLTDNYAGQQTAPASDRFVTKYVNFYRLLAVLEAAPGQIRVVESFTTAFGEAVVLLGYSPDSAETAVTDSLMLQIDFYQAERQSRNRFEMEEKCEMYGLSKTAGSGQQVNIFYYYYRALNNRYEIVSRFNGKEVDFPLTVFRYLGQAAAGETESVSYKLTNGLWKAFLQSLIQNYAAAASTDVDINQLTDQYTSSRQNLSRERLSLSPMLRLKALHVSNNRLSVLLDKIETAKSPAQK